jgi:hypothetical protein
LYLFITTYFFYLLYDQESPILSHLGLKEVERIGERSGKIRSKKWKVSEKEVEKLESYKVHFDIEEVERFVVRCGRIWRKKWKVWS